jgi:phenylalanyl-tRNA synthetase alpha chain
VCVCVCRCVCGWKNISQFSRSCPHHLGSFRLLQANRTAIFVIIMAEDSGAKIEQLLLTTLNTQGEIEDSWAFAANNGLDHQAVVGALKSLLVDSYVIEEALSTTLWSLTDEGKEMVTLGSPEFQVYQAVPAGEAGKSMADLQKELPEASKIGLGPCMKNKWLKKQGDLVLRVAESVKDETAEVLAQVSNGVEVPEEELKNLKRRKLVQQTVRKSYKITKGPSFRAQRVRRMADLTKDMLGDKDQVRNRKDIYGVVAN